MSKNKKIFFIIGDFVQGGVESNMANITSELVKKKYDVTVLSLTSKSNVSKSWFDKKVKIKSFKWPRMLSFIPLWWHFLFHRYDAVISAVEFVNVFTIIAHKLSFQKSQLITTTHTNLTLELKNNYSKKLIIVFKLAHWLYPYADHSVAVSNGVGDSIRKILGLHKINVKTIYNPAAKESAFTLKPKAPHPWFKEKTPVIIGCGRLTKQKDFPLLINAFAKVIKQKNARLIILGEGELRPQLEKQINDLGLEDKVLLAGNVNSPESYMYHARLFVLSSLWEGFGNVIVEALSVGCPVVSMNCPSGPAEILEDGKWGTLVDKRDPENLANAMIKELQSPKPKKENLQKRAKDFTSEKIAKEYLKLVGLGYKIHYKKGT